MNLKRIYFSGLVFVLFLVSCRDESLSPIPDMNDNIGAATKIAINANRNSFRLGSGIANEYLEFTLNVDGYEVTEVAEVELQFTFTENSPARTVGPVLLKKVNAFPATVQVTAQEAATAIGNGFTVNDFQNGDRFRLTFPILTADGRRLTVALNSELCVQPAQPLFGSCQVQWNVVN